MYHVEVYEKPTKGHSWATSETERIICLHKGE